MGCCATPGITAEHSGKGFSGEAIDFELTGTGDFFTRHGKIITALSDLDACCGSGQNTRMTAIRAQYASAQQDVMDGFYDKTNAW